MCYFKKRMKIAATTVLLPKWCFIVMAFVLVLFCERTSAQIIPVNRTIVWSSDTVGVPGGIPNRTNIYTTLNPGATAAQINTAIANCPNGQVVYLSAGTYTLSAAIHFNSKSGVTLRGAGMGQTILNVSSVTTGGTTAIDSAQTGVGAYVNITSGYTAGSSNIVVSSASGFSVGTIVSVTETDEPGMVYADSTGRHNSVEGIVTAINGTTLTIWPPLVYTFQSALSPQCCPKNAVSVQFCGIENLTIQSSTATTALANIWWDGAYGCWLKNVETAWASTYSVYFSSSLRCEIRHCYIHDNASYQDGVGICLENGYYLAGCNGFLVEDNIFARMDNGIVLEGASGSVIAYNFNTNSYSAQVNWLIPAFGANHKAHGLMNLWEGNAGEEFQSDGYHGSTSYQTLLRNWIHGMSTNATPYRKMIDLNRFSYYFNVVGNILGGSWAGSSTTYEMTGSPDYLSQPCIYRLGYPNMGNNSSGAAVAIAAYAGTYPDPTVKSTLLRHGNYDFKSAAIVWDPTITNHTIPNSYFYSSKPAYFGSLTWPPFDPSKPLAASPTNIPAGYRYINNNVDPPGSGTAPPQVLGFHVVTNSIPGP